MAAPDIIKKLVDDFERLEGGPVPESFDEAQLRVSYVNPFWEALGWKVRDPGEVVIEKVVPMRHSTKRADYCFLLNGRPAFVLEAKDFRVRLDDADVVFQLNRYGYNIPVDFGFLTNFAELQLYETWKPPLIENPVKNRVKKFHFEYPEYVERWDELEAALAREAVAGGALNEFLTKKEPTRNKEAVDRKFFERLNDWRTELARDVALRNPDLSVHDINEAVQRLLDRCVFIRVIEDRGIEATELLLDALSRWKVEREKKLYRYVVDKFRYLDPQYNGELFDKHFSEQLLIDDKPLKDFIESLYYPKCPYQFNVVGVEMLGTIYERFLGSEIRLTPTHRAVVEPKPEVRKAGGVYYTPKYIVDYIVENTVGELLKKCKTPAQVAKLKILDPACGSGSFLLGAFQRLIDWHEDYFNANPDKIGKGLAAACWYDADEGKHRLTARYKGQILVNNLFGVDIDPQACEVTTMSLYLKVLEAVNVQFLMKTALLPQLDNNIKCGNSLIGSDYWDFVREKQGKLFKRTEKEERRVRPFDWEVEFADIMKAGGFDAVIGNPPWVRGPSITTGDFKYFENEFTSVRGQPDLYVLFVEKASKLVKKKGLFSFIVPRFILFNLETEKIREILYKKNKLICVADSASPFEGVSTESIIYICENATKPEYSITVLYINYEGTISKVTEIPKNIVAEAPNQIINILYDPVYDAILKKVRGERVVPLKKICSVKRGMEIGKKKLRSIKSGYEALIGEDTTRYLVSWRGTYVGETEKEARRLKPVSEKEKILIRRVASSLVGAIDFDGRHFSKNLYAIYDVDTSLIKPLYLLGLLNSRLILFYFMNYFTTKKVDIFPEVQAYQLSELPIRIIDFSNSAEVARHGEMVALVDEMLELHKRLHAARSDADKKMYEKAIAATDRKVDALVYELYRLTAEEIKTVEGSN